MNPNEEFIINWANTLKKTDDGAVMIATRTAEKLKEDGYAPSEISDVMVADNYDINLVDQVINNIFASDTQEEIVTAEEKVTTYVVPTSYEDVRSFVESTLRECSAKEFMERLARAEYPIIKDMNDHKFESFVRLAERAKNDKYAREVLHSDLLPFVETAMYEAVKLSEDNKPKTIVASVDDDKYTVSYSLKDINDVFVKSAKCSCEKYTKGNYSDFGLACEHIVSAVDKISPNYKLPRNFAG